MDSLPQFPHIPIEFLEAVENALKVGDHKHQGDDFKECESLTVQQYIKKTFRHLRKFRKGADYDIDDGQHHLGAVGADAAICYWLWLKRPKSDNRVHKQSTADFLREQYLNGIGKLN